MVFVPEPIDETRCPKCKQQWTSAQAIPIPKGDLKLHPCMLLHGPSGHGGVYADLYFAWHRGGLAEDGGPGWEDVLDEIDRGEPITDEQRQRLKELDEQIDAL